MLSGKLDQRCRPAGIRLGRQPVCGSRRSPRTTGRDLLDVAGALHLAFGRRLGSGQRLIDAKKFPDAVKEFEEATKLFPDNADAKNFLKKAKDGK